MEHFYKLLVILILSVLNCSAEDNGRVSLDDAFKLCNEKMDDGDACFAQCMFEKAKWLDDSGYIAEEKMIQFFESDPKIKPDWLPKIIEVHKGCLESADGDKNECAALHNVRECIIEKFSG